MPPITRTLTAGIFALTPANGVYYAGYDELSGPKRALTIMQNAGATGAQILRANPNEKYIQIEGKLIFNSPSEFINGVRAFVAAMMVKGFDFTINNDVGEFKYEGCYVQNTDTLNAMLKASNISSSDFRIVIVAPKGFAVSTTDTTLTDHGITDGPHSKGFTIDGTANPEPLIQITFNTASDITGVIFKNITTNTEISIPGLTLADDDILYIDTKNTRVLLNSTSIDYDGVFPDFQAGLNNCLFTFSGASNVAIEQISYDAEEQIYGNKQVSQQITTGGTGFSISQLALQLKKVFQSVYTLVDACTATTLDTGVWTASGTEYQLPGTEYRLGNGSDDSNANNAQTTSLTSVATNSVGWKVNYEFGNGNSLAGTAALLGVRSADSSKIISLRQRGEQIHDDNKHYYTLETTGFGGAGVSEVDLGTTTGTLEIIQVGGNIEVYYAGALRLTIVGYTLGAMLLQAKTFSGSNCRVRINNVYGKADPNANTDITVEIQGDSTGEPDGTPISDGTLTIPATSVDTDFAAVLEGFVVGSLPALSSATVYHVVVYQTGGDVNNYYLIKKNTAGGLSGGTLEKSADGGATWSEETGDLYLQLYSELPTGVDIDIDIIYNVSHYVAG